MTAKQNTQFAQFDIAQGMNINGCEMLPPGSAMNATTHQGNIPVYEGNALNCSVVVVSYDPQEVVLVVDLGSSVPLGAEISIQIFYSTYAYYGFNQA
jgi:hypothetical protein